MSTTLCVCVCAKYVSQLIRLKNVIYRPGFCQIFDNNINNNKEFSFAARFSRIG